MGRVTSAEFHPAVVPRARLDLDGPETRPMLTHRDRPEALPRVAAAGYRESGSDVRAALPAPARPGLPGVSGRAGFVTPGRGGSRASPPRRPGLAARLPKCGS